MTMDSKGISPMIAVVLLIAFTVAVGGIVSIWLTGFAGTTTSSVESASTNQTKCSGTYIDVLSVTSDAIIIMSRGSQTINEISCFWGNGTNITSVAVTSLAAGASNSGAETRGTQTSITCSGTCLNIGVTGECKSTQSCWN